MKNFTLMLLLLVLTASIAQAQNKKSNEAEINGSYITPTTAVVVEIVIRRDVIIKGPYARYATDLLGVIAPLNDKKTYTIEAVKISGNRVGTHSSVAKKDGKQTSGFKKGNQVIGNKFLDMGITPVYSETTGQKNIKAMANDAAAAIFKIRSRRFDLVTGESSENIFGAGLKAAIDEMARIEREYTELFVGKHLVEYLTYQYEIVPEKGKINYVICRFDPLQGIIDDLNITGNPIVLTTIAENKAVTNIGQQKKKSSNSNNKVMIADIVRCKVTLGEELLSERRLPIFQFGVIGEKPILTNEPTK